MSYDKPCVNKDIAEGENALESAGFAEPED